MESNLLETLLPWQQSPPRPADAFEYTTLRPEVAVSADRRLLSFEYLAPGESRRSVARDAGSFLFFIKGKG